MEKTQRGEPGWFGYEPPSDSGEQRDTISYFFLVSMPDIATPDPETIVTYRNRQILPYLKDTSFFGSELEGGKDGIRTAFAIGYSVGAVLDFFRLCFDRGPESYEEMENYFPILKKLQNRYAGRYAKLESFQFLQIPFLETYLMSRDLRGTPGDFSILISEDHRFGEVVAFGEDGSSTSKIFHDFIERKIRERMERGLSHRPSNR